MGALNGLTHKKSFVFLPLGSVCAVALMMGLALPGSSLADEEPVAAEKMEAKTVEKVQITKKDCRRLVRHQARADVAYKPGVDVRGNPVTAADVSGGFTIPLPDVFEFNVTKDLSAYLGGAEDQLEAQKLATIAAERAAAAADQSVTTANQSVTELESIVSNAETALAADPNNTGLQQALSDAESTLASAQSAQSAAETASSTASADTALAQAGSSAAQTALAQARVRRDSAVAAAAAAPNDTALATAAANAEIAVTTAETAAGNASAAAAVGNSSQAVSEAQTAINAAESIGYDGSTLSSELTSASTLSAGEETNNAAALDALDRVAKSADMTLNVGTVRYNIKTGGMTFNGEPINAEAESLLAEKCAEMLGK